jgi:hypothetical protein
MPEVLSISSEFNDIIAREFPLAAQQLAEAAVAADTVVPFGLFEELNGEAAIPFIFGDKTNIRFLNTSGVEGEEGRKGGSGQGKGGDEYDDDHQTDG